MTDPRPRPFRSRCCALLVLCALAALAASAPAQRSSTGVKRGPWTTRADVPEGWVLHKTRHYQIQSQCGLDKARRLGLHMEAMNKVYRRMFRPERQASKPYAIKLLADREAFVAYGRSPGAAAYYSASDREMVCYDTGRWSDEDAADGAGDGTPATGDAAAQDPRAAALARLQRMRELMRMDLLGAAAHEGWHQYFHWYVGSWVQLPSWINEGMGDYFYTAIPKQVKGRKMPAELGRQFPMRLLTIQRAVEQDRHVPIRELLRYTQRQYYANSAVCYAEGWALCQFLLHSGDKDYAKVIPIFVRLVEDDTNMEAVTKKAFRRIDLDELEREFVAWVEAQQIEGLDG